MSICTANATHAELSVRALQHGKHVLCEKPMATTSADAQKMVDAAARSGRMLMIGHNQRLVPAHKLAKEILESGRLSRTLSFQTTFSHGGPESWLSRKNARDVVFQQRPIRRQRAVRPGDSQAGQGKSPIPGDECLSAIRIVERILA